MKRKSGKKPYSQLERENEELREGFELIMEILEDLGFLEPPEMHYDDETEDLDDPPSNVKILNPEPAGIVEPKE